MVGLCHKTISTYWDALRLQGRCANGAMSDEHILPVNRILIRLSSRASMQSYSTPYPGLIMSTSSRPGIVRSTLS